MPQNKKFAHWPLVAIIGLLSASFLLAFLMQPGKSENQIMQFVQNIGTKNKGILMQPIVEVAPTIVANQNTFEDWQGQVGNATLWTVVVPVFGNCDVSCLDNIQLIDNVGIRLDRLSGRLNPLIVTDLPIAVFSDFDNFQVFSIEQSQWQQLQLNSQSVILVDPRGFAILSYPYPTVAADLFADLKFLIKNSR